MRPSAIIVARARENSHGKSAGSAGLDFDLIVMEDGGKAIEFVRGQGDNAGRPIPDLAAQVPYFDGYIKKDSRPPICSIPSKA